MMRNQEPDLTAAGQRACINALLPSLVSGSSPGQSCVPGLENRRVTWEKLLISSYTEAYIAGAA
jgi:hypothetical protein